MNVVRRCIAYLFACGQYVIAQPERSAMVAVVGPCMKRAYHPGPHSLPPGWSSPVPQEAE